jgi:hypothetical protein
MFLEAGLDFSTLSPGYASNEGIYDLDRTAERAREVRLWLRNRPEREIVLVAHGDILRWIVDERHSSRVSTKYKTVQMFYRSDSSGPITIDHTTTHHICQEYLTDNPQRWGNAEMIEFTFASDEDPDALVKQRGSGVVGRAHRL